jgi:hypothetical protein
MVRCDHHIILSRISENLGISVEHVRHVITQILWYSEVSAVWVLMSSDDEQKVTHMGISLKHLLRYKREGDKFLDRIVGADESSVCPVVWRLNTWNHSRNICYWRDQKRIAPYPALVR